MTDVMQDEEVWFVIYEDPTKDKQKFSLYPSAMYDTHEEAVSVASRATRRGKHSIGTFYIVKLVSANDVIGHKGRMP